MASRYKFFEDVYNSDFKHTVKGFMSVDNINSLLETNSDVLYTIPFSERYRPDIISTKFYGDPTLFWVLVYINGIGDSPEGFYSGRIIRIPAYERVLELM